eukprot:3475980-Amphidinium_carterae.1
MEKMKTLARDIWSKVNQYWTSHYQLRHDEEANPSNPCHAQQTEDLWRQFRGRERLVAEETCLELGTTLADLAVAAWHMKYHDDEWAFGKEDKGDYPWNFFVDELCDAKMLHGK